MDIEQNLQSLGLTNSEIKIYLELLKLGTSKVNIIAKRLSLPRTTIYNVLDSLILKGIVSYIVKSGVKCFEAIDPKRLLIIEKEKLNNLKLIIPKLEKLKQTVGKRPKVEIFEGKEGIKSILEEILKLPEKSVYYSYANYDLFEYLSFYFPNFIKRKIKKKIRARVIQEKKSKLEKNRKEGEKLLVNMKFLSQRFDSNVFIFGNKTAFITFSKQTILGILVENESIARTQKQVFDNLWKLAK